MRFIAILACLVLMGCTHGMTYDEQIRDIRKCREVHGTPFLGSNILFQPVIWCTPEGNRDRY